MITHRRHAQRHRYGTGPAAVVVAAILATCGLLLLAALFLTSQHAGPVTGAPGPQVLRPPAASEQITVMPDEGAMRAAWHREHEHHLAEEHKRHLASLRHKLHEERVWY